MNENSWRVITKLEEDQRKVRDQLAAARIKQLEQELKDLKWNRALEVQMFEGLIKDLRDDNNKLRRGAYLHNKTQAALDLALKEKDKAVKEATSWRDHFNGACKAAADMLRELEEATAACRKARDQAEADRKDVEYWRREWHKEFKEHTATLRELDKANEDLRRANP